MKRYVFLFAVAVVLSLVGLTIPAILAAGIAWMLHVVPETLGSLKPIAPLQRTARGRAGYIVSQPKTAEGRQSG